MSRKSHCHSFLLYPWTENIFLHVCIYIKKTPNSFAYKLHFFTFCNVVLAASQIRGTDGNDTFRGLPELNTISHMKRTT